MPGLCSLLKGRGVFLQDRMSEREKKQEWFGCDMVPVLSDLWVLRGWPWTPQEEAFQTKGKGFAFWEVVGLRTKAGWLQMSWEPWGWEVQLSSQAPLLAVWQPRVSDTQRRVSLRECVLVKVFSDRSWTICPWELGNEGKIGGGKMWRSCMLPGPKASRIWAAVSTQTHLYLQFPEA